MLTLLIGLVLGAVLGWIGLWLLAAWEGRPLDKPHLGWPHRRH
jgi:NhaP-type Na+/H+ or K+/H+ antiporter